MPVHTPSFLQKPQDMTRDLGRRQRGGTSQQYCFLHPCRLTDVSKTWTSTHVTHALSFCNYVHTPVCVSLVVLLVPLKASHWLIVPAPTSSSLTDPLHLRVVVPSPSGPQGSEAAQRGLWMPMTWLPGSCGEFQPASLSQRASALQFKFKLPWFPRILMRKRSNAYTNIYQEPSG